MKLYILLLLVFPILLTANSLEVCPDCEYTSITQAANEAVPGDTILLNGTFTRGDKVTELKGTPENWIHIIGINDATYDGNTTAIQLSDCEYLYISNITIQGQSLNGMNIDDAGTYDTPTHHIIIENCTFRDMASTGNNDLLKLSGLDNFEIRNCVFQNGSAGGSGIDMVGCHFGIINNNYFENMGSNCIQAKGGTHDVSIERNMFINGGFRGINIGGSTGLEFFRPQDANFESRDMEVNSNIFVGGECAVAYVGTVNSSVFNNTIIGSRKWVFRILQETVDPNRFLTCGDNSFFNNLVLMDDSLSRTVNIGPNSRPETFFFSNNYWYHIDNNEWNHNLPSEDNNPILDENISLTEKYGYNIYPEKNSVLVGAGLSLLDRTLAFDSIPFYTFAPTIGAFELQTGTSDVIQTKTKGITVLGNILEIEDSSLEKYKLYNYSGILLSEGIIDNSRINILGIKEKYIIAILESKNKREIIIVIR